jgi:hypothetical protein
MQHFPETLVYVENEYSVIIQICISTFEFYTMKTIDTTKRRAHCRHDYLAQ